MRTRRLKVAKFVAGDKFGGKPSIGRRWPLSACATFIHPSSMRFVRMHEQPSSLVAMGSSTLQTSLIAPRLPLVRVDMYHRPELPDLVWTRKQPSSVVDDLPLRYRQPSSAPNRVPPNAKHPPSALVGIQSLLSTSAIGPRRRRSRPTFCLCSGRWSLSRRFDA